MSQPYVVRKTQRELLRLSVATGRWTAPARLLPDVLIVGAQRCGTTSMFKTLVQHPDVVRPFLRKGVHYFDLRHDRGMGWYRGNFPLGLSSRLRRPGRGRPHTLESSPYYMFHPLAAARFSASLPGVRVLVLLRDPVERAYSGHSHELARGFETEPFEAALDLEDERLAGQRQRMLDEPGYESWDYQHHSYLARGRYIEQLLALEEHLGRDRIHVVDSQDFFTRPAEVFPAVLDFLQLEQVGGIEFEQHNARSRAPMAPTLRGRLEERFAPYDEQLASWWGRTPSWRQ